MTAMTQPQVLDAMPQAPSRPARARLQDEEGDAPSVGTPIGTPVSGAPRYTDQPKTWFDRVEAFVSSLSVRDTFWHRVCSIIWLPLAFFSGIKMKQVDATTF